MDFTGNGRLLASRARSSVPAVSRIRAAGGKRRLTLTVGIRRLVVGTPMCRRSPWRDDIRLHSPAWRPSRRQSWPSNYGEDPRTIRGTRVRAGYARSQGTCSGSSTARGISRPLRSPRSAVGSENRSPTPARATMRPWLISTSSPRVWSGRLRTTLSSNSKARRHGPVARAAGKAGRLSESSWNFDGGPVG